MTILNDVLHCNVQIDDCQRLGRLFEGRNKSRPFRFTVKDFESKHKILDCAKRLKNHETYSRVYLTPDLTKNQREQAFNLREEKRRRTREGEQNLIIRRGKIIKAPDQQNDHNYALNLTRQNDHNYAPNHTRNTNVATPATGEPGRAGATFR